MLTPAGSKLRSAGVITSVAIDNCDECCILTREERGERRGKEGKGERGGEGIKGESNERTLCSIHVLYITFYPLLK